MGKDFVDMGIIEVLIISRELIVSQTKKDKAKLFFLFRKPKKRYKASYFPGLFFTNNFNVEQTKRYLTEINPGDVVILKYTPERLRIRVPKKNSHEGYEEYMDTFLVVKEMTKLYTLESEKIFQDIPKQVNIVDDKLFQELKEEEIDKVEKSFEKRIKKYANQEVV